MKHISFQMVSFLIVLIMFSNILCSVVREHCNFSSNTCEEDVLSQCIGLLCYVLVKSGALILLENIPIFCLFR